jgi:hypothetical protein
MTEEQKQEIRPPRPDSGVNIELIAAIVVGILSFAVLRMAG